MGSNRRARATRKACSAAQALGPTGALLLGITCAVGFIYNGPSFVVWTQLWRGLGSVQEIVEGVSPAAPGAARPGASPGAQGQKFPTVSPERAAAVAAERVKLEKFWPKGEVVLPLATSRNPAPDGGAALRDRLRARLERKEAFQFVAFGSSVEAGHDNYGNQTWPVLLGSVLRPAFEAAGFDFEATNMGFGGWGEAPFSTTCVKDKAGQEADAVSWEWHMFQDPACECFHFLAEVNDLPRRPVVFSFADTGLEFKGVYSGLGETVAATKKIRNFEEMGQSKRWRDPAWYATEGYVSDEEMKMYSEQWEKHVRLARPTFQGTKTRTQPEITGIAKLFIGSGMGYYPVVVSAPSAKVNDPWYLVRGKALNINWHPGPLGHLLIAHMVGHYILTQLEAVLRGDAAPPRELRGPSADNPLVNHGPVIKSDGKCGNLRPQQCWTGTEPSPEGIDLQLRRAKESKDTWEVGWSAQARMPADSIGVKDKRRVYKGMKTSGELILDLMVPDNLKEPYALLCDAPCGWNCNGVRGFMPATRHDRWVDKDRDHRHDVSDVAFTIDGERVPLERLQQLWKDMFAPSTGKFCPGCTNMNLVCQPLGPLRPGRRLIGLTVEPNTKKNARMVVELLHVLLVGEPSPSPAPLPLPPPSRLVPPPPAAPRPTERPSPRPTPQPAPPPAPGARSKPAAGVASRSAAADLVAAERVKLEKFWPKGDVVLKLAATRNPALDGGKVLRDRLRARLERKEAFVFVSFGSSVEAGHDNYGNQSWPTLLPRTLQPAFQAAGFDFKARNMGVGGWGEAPYSTTCTKEKAGEDVDALSWEWHMFQDPACECFHFLADASEMPRRPVVFSFSDTGLEFKALYSGIGESMKIVVDANKGTDFLKKHSQLGQQNPYHDPEWYATEDYISAKDLSMISVEMKKHVLLKNPNFKGTKTRTQPENVGVVQPFIKQGLGYYPFVVSAPSAEVNMPWYLARQKTLNINWHPGPLGHLLIAHMVGHYVLTQLEAVLRETPPRELRGPTKDNPLVNSGPVIKYDGKCGTMRTQQCWTGAEPHPDKIDLQLRRAKESKDSWKVDWSIQARPPRDEIGVKDLRKVFRGSKASGELIIDLMVPDNLKEPYALFCEAPCGWKCTNVKGWLVAAKHQRWGTGPNHTHNVSDVAFTIDGEPVPLLRLQESYVDLLDSKTGRFCPGCKNLNIVCQPIGPLRPGRRLVGLRVDPKSRSDKHDELEVELLHVILVGEPK